MATAGKNRQLRPGNAKVDIVNWRRSIGVADRSFALLPSYPSSSYNRSLDRVTFTGRTLAKSKNLTCFSNYAIYDEDMVHARA